MTTDFRKVQNIKYRQKIARPKRDNNKERHPKCAGGEKHC